MDHSFQQTLGKNISLLRQKASRHSIIGVTIAVAAILIATFVSGYMLTGEISLTSIATVQKTNKVLWVLDAMPFLFAFWGQYVSSVLSEEAGTMIVNQTKDLRQQSALLEQRAAHQATHDALTGLPNRVLFIDRLQQATIAAKRDSSLLAVLILDVDRFKEVNDTLGHYNGDRLLKQVGLRLTGVIRESDTLARIGGDEFGFILPKTSWKRRYRQSHRQNQKGPGRDLRPRGLSPSRSRQVSAPPSFPNMARTPIPSFSEPMWRCMPPSITICGYAAVFKGSGPAHPPPPDPDGRTATGDQR